MDRPWCVVVSYDFTAQIPGSSIRVEAFVRALRRAGFGVLVLTASPPAEHPPLPDGCRAVSIGSPERGWGGGIRADSLGGNPRWLRALSVAKRFLPLERQMAWYPAFLAHAARACRGLAARAVITVTAPYSMMPLGVWLARRLGAAHVIDVRDDWVDRFRIERRSALNRALTDRWARYHVTRADAVTVVSPWTARRLAALGARIREVPNGYPEEAFARIPMEARSADPGPTLDIVHLGWLGDFRDLSTLVRAIDSLPDEEPRVRVVQVGLIDEGQRRVLGGSARAVIEAPCSHAEAVRRMAAADVLLAVPGHGIPAAISGKLYEYLRARRPVLLLARPGAAADLVRHAGEPWIADPDDAEGISGILQQLRALKREGRLAARSDPSFVATLGREAAADLFAAAVREAVASPSGGAAAAGEGAGSASGVARGSGDSDVRGSAR